MLPFRIPQNAVRLTLSVLRALFEHPAVSALDCDCLLSLMSTFTRILLLSAMGGRDVETKKAT